MRSWSKQRHSLGAAVLALALCAPGLSAAAPAAAIEFAVGNGEVLGAAGRSRPAVKGAEVNPGETVNTNQGRVQLRFTDGAYMSLQPGSQFRIDEYRWNGRADGSERGGGQGRVIAR